MGDPADGAASGHYYPPGAAGRRAAKRDARWTRPKPAHDWRWVVGGIGRALIIIGLLMFGFVAYQLWGTAIQTAQAQGDLKAEFRRQLEDALSATTTSTSSTSSTSSSTSTTVAASTSVGGVNTLLPGTTVAATSAPTTVAITVAPSTTSPSGTAPAPAAPRPQLGDPIALIDAPSMDLHNWAVVEGVGTNQLKDGVGHFPETPLPGELGNAVLAGHRTSHGAPFLHIDRLKNGDTVTLMTVGGNTFVYAVTGTEVVSPNDGAAVIPTVDPTRATLTLVSCHPAYTTRQRIVVRAELVPEQSAPPSEPPPGTAPPSTDLTTIPVDDLPTTTSAAGGGAAPTTGAAPPPTTTPSPAVTQPVVTTPPSGQGSEVFAQGWFDDSGAWPHVVAWGVLLTAITVGGWWLSRRYRRYWVGIAAATVPFVVVLYFWYENVNRLLPAGF